MNIYKIEAKSTALNIAVSRFTGDRCRDSASGPSHSESLRNSAARTLSADIQMRSCGRSRDTSDPPPEGQTSGNAALSVSRIDAFFFGFYRGHHSDFFWVLRSPS